MNAQPKPRTPPPSDYVCSACKKPVDAVLERHKTMGVFVPHWVAGPCHNPRCPEYVPEQVPVNPVRGATWEKLTDWSPR